MDIKDTKTLCWLAGLYEGEAYFAGGIPSEPNLPRVALNMTDEDIVARAAEITGVGYVAVDRKESHWSMTYKTIVRGTRAVALMKALKPLMGKRRQERIDGILNNYSYPKPNRVLAKLTEEQVRAIKKRLATGETAKSIAKDFSITHYNVWAIREGKSWKHVRAEDDPEQAYETPSEILIPDVPVASLEIEENRLSWIAGLLEAEGSFMKGTPSEPNTPRVSVPMTDEDIIARLAEFLQAKYSRLPPRKENHKPVYRVMIRGSKAVELMKRLYPLMGKRRQSQIQKALDSYTEFSQNGERNPSAKISENQAREIKRRVLAGESVKIIAQEFSVNVSIVREIKYGRTWKHT